jgi:formylglycine-generating enzyme required for sulfatase activity
MVALAPIPDLTPQADAPAAAPPSQSETPKQADGQVIRDCATCPELIVVKAGQFAMGEGSEGLEQQVSLTTTQEVTIAAPFAIGRTEITFDEWSQCVADGGCTSHPADENWGRGRRPAINVSFNDITQQYLPWLSRKTGFTYRLPTEAEWEFAARGGASAAAGQAYSFGNDGALLCQYGNSSDGAGGTCSDGFANTAPAGSLKANSLGLFDMHGNVWEWMGDCWQPQYSAKAAKPAGTCTTRVLRGGSWASNAAALRSAARGWEKQDRSKSSIGFRVVRVLP